MEVTFVTVGLACIIGAIVRGGLSAFNISFPVLTSWWRQLLLGGFGVFLLVFGLLYFGNASGSDSGTPRVGGDTTPTSTASGQERPTATEGNSLATAEPPTPTEPDIIIGGDKPQGHGTVDPCSGVTVTIEAVRRDEFRLYLSLRVANDFTDAIELPALEYVYLSDSTGSTFNIDEFGNLGLPWGIGPEVLPGRAFSSDIVYEELAGHTGTGSLEIANILRAHTATPYCSVQVDGITLP